VGVGGDQGGSTDGLKRVGRGRQRAQEGQKGQYGIEEFKMTRGRPKGIQWRDAKIGHPGVSSEVKGVRRGQVGEWEAEEDQGGLGGPRGGQRKNQGIREGSWDQSIN
jgi:hypothetical protein